jgi:hypothetical protein
MEYELTRGGSLVGKVRHSEYNYWPVWRSAGLATGSLHIGYASLKGWRSLAGVDKSSKSFSFSVDVTASVTPFWMAFLPSLHYVRSAALNSIKRDSWHGLEAAMQLTVMDELVGQDNQETRVLTLNSLFCTVHGHR